MLWYTYNRSSFFKSEQFLWCLKNYLYEFEIFTFKAYDVWLFIYQHLLNSGSQKNERYSVKLHNKQEALLKDITNN